MIEQVIEPRTAEIAEGMTVKRILPFRAKRRVGPFTFLDHMGPALVKGDGSSDVLPHPHIGLSTVTFLFEGEMIHRDSLGTEMTIRPGDVNWMTAGRGIVHSERFEKSTSPKKLHGLQAWVALPLDAEETEPAFEHTPKSSLPNFTENGVAISLVAGEAFGKKSSVRTHSKLFYFMAEMPSGKRLAFVRPGEESALYLVKGSVRVAGRSYAAPVMLVFQLGAEVLIEAESDSFGAFLGGEPLEGERFIYWNFVASSKEKIEEAKRRWEEQRFPKIPGETEFVPLPPQTK